MTTTTTSRQLQQENMTTTLAANADQTTKYCDLQCTAPCGLWEY